MQKSYAESAHLCDRFCEACRDPSMKLGYARVSTEDQRLDRPVRAADSRVDVESCSRKRSPAPPQRPKLARAVRELRTDDILVVTRLDRLARSTAELLRIAEVIAEKTAGLQSLEEP